MIIKEFTLDQFFGPQMAEKMRADDEKRPGYFERLAEQKPILDDLLAVGYKMDTVWMLVNTNELYPEALPVLLKHLQLPYSKRIKEGVIRSLIVNEFRGLAGPTVLTEFNKLENFHRDAPLVSPFLMAIQCLADRSMTADLEAMLVDPKYAGIASYLEKAIRKSKRK
jgi:hypothetical protein